MKKLTGLAMALALSVGFGMAPSHAAPLSPPAPGDPVYVGDAPALDEGNEVIKVMVLLKAQPEGVGDTTAGLSAVHGVVDRWSARDGVSIRRQFGTLVRGFSASLPANLISQLAADPDVASVTPLAMYYPTMQTAGALTTSVQARSSHDVDGRGLLVSIIDSGIDIQHQDMRLDDGVPEKLAPTPGFNAKVPYGWNFADDNAEVKDSGSQHGMHVAGIVAANAGPNASVASGRINGIAPNAQLLAMKVFSNDPINGGGAAEDDIIAAIEKSVELGADVINMSLGSPNGLSEGGVGEGRAILNATKAGVQVIVAAGNDGLNFSANGTTVDNSGLLDNGTLGSPASTPGAIAVASVDNSASIVQKATAGFAGGSFDFGYQQATGKPDGKAHKLVDCGIGQPTEIPAAAKGNFCLIQRGTLTFADKFKNATTAGASGVLIYNNAGESFVGMGGLDGVTVFGASLFQSTGEKLKAQIAGGVDVSFTTDYVQTPTATPLQPSDFTSWGMTPELEFRPTFAGIGGSVWSTANDNSYQTMSGTSMATPHVAGIYALGLQDYARRFPQLSAPERGDLFTTALSNTAKLLDRGGVPYAPRQMGAGLAQTDAALNSTVFATVDGKPSIALKQLSGAKRVTVTLRNLGAQDRTFTAGGTCVLNEVAVANQPRTTACSTGESATAAASSVTVPAGGTATVDYTIAPKTGTNHWLEGWLQLQSNDPAQPSLTLPYAGFVGDWNAEPIIDKTPASVGDKTTQMAKLGAYSTNMTMLYSFNGSSAYGRGYSLNWISPNGDGVYDDVFPSMALLRSVADLRYSIVDSTGKVVRVLGEDHDKQRSILSKLTAGGRNSNAMSYAWDGTVYDPATDSFRPVPDGAYSYRIEARVSADMPWQVTDLKFNTDTQAPTATLSKQSLAGMWSYTLKLDDHGGSGLTTSGVQVTDGQTGKALTVRLGTGNTFTFTAYSENIGHPLKIVYTDVAGNAGSVVDIVGGAGVKFLETSRFAHPINAKSKDAAKQPIIVDGKIDLSAAVSADVVSATVNGVPAPIKDGRVSYFAPADNGVASYTVVGLDATGKEVARDVVTITVDQIPPELKFTKVPLDEQGRLVLDANGEAVIEGKVTDNRASAMPPVGADGTINFDDMLWLLDADLDPYDLNVDGTFSVKVKPAATDTSVTFYALDYFDPMTYNFLNLAGVRIPLARPASAQAGGALQITFDESRFDGATTSSGISTQPFGDSIYVLDKTYKGLSVEGDQAYLTLSGRFNRAPGSFLIKGQPVALDANNHFAVKLPLTEGITTVGYEVHDSDGSLVTMSAWKFLYDKTLPAYELDATPQVAPDGAIYLKTASGDITLQGSVWDNAFGYTFAVNGNTVANASSIWDSGMAQNKRQYQVTVPGKDGQFVRVSLSDFVGNGIERTIPVLADLVDPVLTVDGVAQDQAVAPTTRITVKATDAHLQNLLVNVDGKPVAAKRTTPPPAAGAKLVVTNTGNPNAAQTTAAAGASASGADPTLLTYELTGLAGGKHVLEATATDFSGRSTQLLLPFVVDSAPVIAGPDTVTLDPDDGPLLDQLRTVYTVTDDVDRMLQVDADTSTLLLDATTPLQLSATDAAGNVTTRTISVLLQRSEKSLTGSCGTLTGRFEKGDSVSITCTRQADATTLVTVANTSAVKVSGTLTLPGLAGPVVVVSGNLPAGTPVESTVRDGALEFTAYAVASYRLGTPVVPEPEQPTKPGNPTPGGPNKPDNPTPGQPKPDKPGNPTPGQPKPDKPGNPNPGKPEKPGKPGQPGKPAEADPVALLQDGNAAVSLAGLPLVGVGALLLRRRR